jgi:DNA gyrase/topoisomerase IV subunit B
MSASRKPRYQKLDQIDHVLKRSDLWLGSNKPKKSEEYIAEGTDDGYKIYKKTITFPPALLRIFVEVLSNAIDNFERSKTTKTKCTKISIKIDKESGETMVWNDGDVIPIEVNEEGVYNHSMIFGTLLSGSNFDDDEERFVSGKNGVGSKGTNIFSTKFKVRGFDPSVKKILTQEWTTNMRETKGPIVKDSKLAKGFTEITYTPDFEKFGVKGYTNDIIALYTKYIIDAAMLCGVKIELNDEVIPIKNLSDYSKLYEAPTDEKLYIKFKSSEMLLTPCDDFQAISFVNGICTKQGGQHVDAWCEAIFRPLLDKFNKKGKPALNITNIKQYFRIFVVATVDKPVFSSQEKEKLESPTVEVNVKTTEINKIMKWSVGETIQDFIRSKEMVVLKKAEKKSRGYVKIEGLDPANNAGGKFSSDCSLILCEGLSAKTYAVAGIEKGVYSKSGRNWYGILALRGKLLNCRNASPSMIAKNNEITNIIKALGLRHEVDYTDDKNYKQLNYGKVILMTDADVDGLHIEGLVMNFFHSLFPSLMEREEPYIIALKTPIVRVFKKSKDILFYDERRFKEYASKQTTKFEKKYYKGLGTTKPEDVPDTFGSKIVEYITDDNLNVNMNKVFHKKHSDDRKQWLADYKCDNYVSLDDGGEIVQMNMSDFIDGEMIKFSIDDCLAKGTLVPRWNGEICKVEEVSIGDTLIGDDGEPRIVKNKIEGIGKLFEVIQPKAKTYVVNENHILSVKMPLHKKIYWNDVSKSWETRWLDTECKKIRTKCIRIPIQCNECDKILTIENLKQHHKSLHKNIQFITPIISEEEKNNYYIKIKKFLDTISDDNILDIKIKDYCAFSDSTKKRLSGFIGRCVQWENKDVELDPYILGLWLGDGGQDGNKFCINTEKDPEILDYLQQWGKNNNTQFKLIKNSKYDFSISKIDGIKNKGVSNFKQLLQKYNLIDNKHIPDNYLITSRETRLKLLAGFIDSDGYVSDDGIIQISQGMNHEKLAYQLIFLIRSLGFMCHNHISKKKWKHNGVEKFGTGISITLSGYGVEDIPTKVIRKKCYNSIRDTSNTGNLKIKEIGIGEYVGIEVDSNHRFVIDDFTVVHNCARNIPCGIDGLKVSQRKVLYAVKKKNLKFTAKSLKVAQLGGYVAEHTNYHHGEQNLYDTIVKMANEYVGSNNIPLLYRDGMFSTRLNGKDAASARYIYTKMDMLTHLIFRQEDDILLEYVIDDGDQVEPKFYIPIIPMILVNGCTVGIGSGWSCSIPNYNPLELIDCIKIWLNNGLSISNEENTSILPDLMPWYRGFTGTIQKSGNAKFITHGIITEGKKDEKIVTELPIGLWTDKFKENLEDLLEAKQIKSMKNYSTPKTVNFTITQSTNGIEINPDTLKIHSYLYTSNMVLFNQEERLKKYNQVDDIIDDFCKVRYEYYIKRKKHQINELETEIKFLGNKERFVNAVMNNSLNVMNVPEDDIVKELEKQKYDKFFGNNIENPDVEEDTNTSSKGYDYLLRLQIRTFTKEKVKKLKNDIASKIEDLNTLKSTSERNIWNSELDEFSLEYQKFLKIMEQTEPKSKKSKK